jgi:hypothetical protein
MSWEFLLLLACPLMMLFCMKGMFMGNKDSKANTSQEIQQMQIQMGELIEQNHKLMKELETRGSSSNVTELPNESSPKRSIS